MLRKSLWIGLCVLSLVIGRMPAAAGTLPDSAYISGLVGHAQSFTLSCESRSAADWAAFWGVAVDEAQFQADLPSSDNPDEGFVGSPNGAWGGIPPASYGVHANPVARLLRSYGLRAEAHKDLSWNDLRAEIAAGRPVIVWLIGQVWAGAPVDYTASDGATTTVARFEHTMILFGYDETRVHLADAYSGWNETFPLDTFLASWKVLGNMAVTGQGPEDRPAGPQPQPGGDTYTVKAGEYLSALAERFGTTWKTLAELNGIAYPYVIYPGQELKLPAAPGESSAASNPPPAAQPTPNYKFHLVLPMVANGGTQSGPAEQPAATPEPAAAQPQTYTVQAGEFLIELANRFNVDWRQLADANNIAYPYVIYPGQELKLP